MKKKIIISIMLIVILSLSVYSYAAKSKVVEPTKEATTLTENQLQYFFSQPNHNTDQELIKVINSAKTSLDIAIYSITKPTIVDAIVKAQKRGVNVRIISDKTEAKTKKQSIALKLFSNNNIPVKINKHSGLMHLKVTIADKTIVTTGSYNYSDGATNDNDEVLVVLNNADIAKDWDAKFESMWNDNVKFVDYK